jgi:glycosyltransferase involved in cell wall biosynthesis
MSKTIFFKFKKTNIKIINNGIEINKINTNYKISNLIEKKFINGIVLARVQEDKGHEDLIKAFRLLPKDLKNKIKIFFIGDGNEKYIFYLKKLIKDYELNNNFYFIGYIDGNGRDIIKYFDFLVSPSRYFEGFGLSIVESLSVGTIVVSTKVGGVTDYLDNSNSFLVNPFNKKQISNALIKISRNPKELMNKKANGIQLVKTKLTNNNMGQNYIKFLD